MNAEIGENASARLLRYRKWLTIITLGLVLLPGCVVLILGISIRSARSHLYQLGLTEQTLRDQIETVITGADRVTKSTGRFRSGIAPLSDAAIEMRAPGTSPYPGIERCDLSSLPQPTGDFDSLVWDYMDRRTYSLLSRDPLTKAKADEMQRLAQSWARARPADAYIKLLDEAERLSLGSPRDIQGIKEAIGDVENASVPRWVFERDAVFVACLRQVGLLPAQ